VLRMAQFLGRGGALFQAIPRGHSSDIEMRAEHRLEILLALLTISGNL
jgi:hypothetical protein